MILKKKTQQTLLIYIYISNLNFRKGKFKITDYENFIAENATLKADENGLKIIPKAQIFSIIYKPNFKLRAAIKFEFEVFVIILVLSFLLFNKLLDYVADFKTIKHKSRIEILFLICFFVILFIPMLHIDDSKISKNENRTLATWKPFINKKGEINFNFGKDFDNWFNDRFNLRNEIVSINHNIRHINKIYTFNNSYYDKKYNILYTKNAFGLAEPKNKEEAKKKYLEKLTKFEKYCNDKNIKLYILLVPRQFDFQKHTTLSRKIDNKDFANELIEYLKNNSNLKIVYPKQKMLEANKTAPIYFATDHHWTKKGAYIGYKELITEIKKDFPSVILLEESSLLPYKNHKISEHWDAKFTNGQTYKLLNLSKKFEKKLFLNEYLYYENNLSKKLQRRLPEFKTAKYKTSVDDEFYYPNQNKLKAMVIGNSFARNLVEFLPYSFEKTLRFYDNVRQLNMEIYEPLIEEFKPNIIILNFHTSSISHVLNMYEPKITKEEK